MLNVFVPEPHDLLEKCQTRIICDSCRLIRSLVYHSNECGSEVRTETALVTQ